MKRPIANVYYFVKKLAHRLPTVSVRRSHRWSTKLSVVLQKQTGFAIKGVKHRDPGPMRVLSEFLRPGSVFYDVGANIGLYTVAAGALVHPGGCVIAIEPDPGNCMQLLKNIRLNQTNATVLQVALASTAGEEKFALDLLTSATGHIKSDVYRQAIVGEWTDVDPPSSELAVRTVALDDLVFGSNLPIPNLIKIDVERHELRVLQGMRRLMGESGPDILIEVATENEEPLKRLLQETRYEIVSSFDEGNHFLRKSVDGEIARRS